MVNLLDIQKNIIEAIKFSGKTQTEIAKEIGVCQQTISHYIKGDKLPALDTLANLCISLDLDPADLLCVNKKEI